jgi:hypothetical protein
VNAGTHTATDFQTTAHRVIGIADDDQRAVNRADDLALTSADGTFDVIGVGASFVHIEAPYAKLRGALRLRRRRLCAPFRRVSLGDDGDSGRTFRVSFSSDVFRPVTTSATCARAKSTAGKWSNAGARGSAHEAF